MHTRPPLAAETYSVVPDFGVRGVKAEEVDAVRSCCEAAVCLFRSAVQWCSALDCAQAARSTAESRQYPLARHLDATILFQSHAMLAGMRLRNGRVWK